MSNPITVAIIDDEPNAIVTIELILKEFCPNLHIVTTANTEDQAWELIKQHQPDLVFLDVDMPRGSGFDLLERFPIRKFDVIFISAYSKFAAKASEYNVFAYLTKPVDIDLLRQTCESYRDYRVAGNCKPFRLKPK